MLQKCFAFVTNSVCVFQYGFFFLSFENATLFWNETILINKIIYIITLVQLLYFFLINFFAAYKHIHHQYKFSSFLFILVKICC